MYVCTNVRMPLSMCVYVYMYEVAFGWHLVLAISRLKYGRKKLQLLSSDTRADRVSDTI